MYVGVFYKHTSVPNKRRMSLAKPSLLMRTDPVVSPRAPHISFGSLLVLPRFCTGSFWLCLALCGLILLFLLYFCMVPWWFREIALAVSPGSLSRCCAVCMVLQRLRLGSAVVLLGAASNVRIPKKASENFLANCPGFGRVVLTWFCPPRPPSRWSDAASMAE